jgi:hypothetical protein
MCRACTRAHHMESALTRHDHISDNVIACRVAGTRTRLPHLDLSARQPAAIEASCAV